MSKTLQQELDEYLGVLTDVRKLYTEDGTITPDEQFVLYSLESRIQQLRSSIDRRHAGKQNGQPLAGPNRPGDVGQDKKIAQSAPQVPEEALWIIYRTNVNHLSDRLDKARQEKPQDPKSIEAHKKVFEVHDKMKAAESRREISEAERLSLELARRLDDYETARKQADVAKNKPKRAPDSGLSKEDLLFKKKYEADEVAIRPRVNAVLDKKRSTDDFTMAEQEKVAAIQKEMKDAYAKGNYNKALSTIDLLREQLDHFDATVKSQAAAKITFVSEFGRIRAALDKALERRRLSDEVSAHQKKVEAKKKEMESAAAKGDYAQAYTHLGSLSALIDSFNQKQLAFNKTKEQYVAARARIRMDLERVLGSTWKSKEMADFQERIVAKRDEIDRAVANVDYRQALKLLESLAEMIDQFRRTRPLPSRKALALSSKCHKIIHRMYLGAAAKMDAAAQAYDEALKDHREALRRSDGLVGQILVGVFFAAIGGGAGGAVGALIKKVVNDKTASGGALVDASKDVVKFITRASGSKPLLPPGLPGGDGVELARSIGKRLKEEAATLLHSLESLDDKVLNTHSETEDILVEGEPDKALESDPFLKILGELPNARKEAFALDIWETWIKREMNDGKYAGIVNADSAIRKQTGDDPRLVKLLEEADKEARYLKPKWF